MTAFVSAVTAITVSQAMFLQHSYEPMRDTPNMRFNGLVSTKTTTTTKKKKMMEMKKKKKKSASKRRKVADCALARRHIYMVLGFFQPQRCGRRCDRGTVAT